MRFGSTSLHLLTSKRDEFFFYKYLDSFHQKYKFFRHKTYDLPIIVYFSLFPFYPKLSQVPESLYHLDLLLIMARPRTVSRISQVPSLPAAILIIVILAADHFFLLAGTPWINLLSVTIRQNPRFKNGQYPALRDLLAERTIFDTTPFTIIVGM